MNAIDYTTVPIKTLLVEIANEKYSNFNLFVIAKIKLYNRYKFDTKHVKNKLILKRMNTFNRELYMELNYSYGWNIDVVVDKFIKKKNHVKFRENNYRKYEKGEVSWDVTEKTGNIFTYKWSSDNPIHQYNCIKVEEYKDAYGKVKRKAIVKMENDDLPKYIDTFYTAEEIQEIIDKEIKNYSLKALALKKKLKIFSKNHL